MYRQGKHTPKKLSQFVAFWKRPAMSGEIAAYSSLEKSSMATNR
ncbi:MepB family protein [Neisseria sp. P0008.S010]